MRNLKFRKGNLVEIVVSKYYLGHRFVIGSTSNIKVDEDDLSCYVPYETDLPSTVKGKFLWCSEDRLKLVTPDKGCDIAFDELMLDLKKPAMVNS